MSVKHWLVKSEPNEYSYQRLVKEKRGMWDGVRNFEARNNLRAMSIGDLLLFYHSVNERAVVGVAKVTKEHYPDPTAKKGDWSVVDVAPVKELTEPVTLATLKADPALAEMVVVRRSRLSVTRVTVPEFRRVLKLGKTTL